MASMRFKESELATEGKATGLTPLRYAVYANRLDIVRRMLDACPGLDVEAPLKFSIPLVEGPKAQTVLMAACAWYDNPEMVRALHNAGADMCRLDKGIGHFSPVYAAGNSNLRNIDVLLEIGVNHQGKRVDAWHGSPISLPDLEGVVYPPNFGVMVMFAEYGHVDALAHLKATFIGSRRLPRRTRPTGRASSSSRLLGSHTLWAEHHHTQRQCRRGC